MRWHQTETKYWFSDVFPGQNGKPYSITIEKKHNDFFHTVYIMGEMNKSRKVGNFSSLSEAQRVAEIVYHNGGTAHGAARK